MDLLVSAAAGVRRQMLRFRRRYSKLRAFVPLPLYRRLHKGVQASRKLRTFYVTVRHESALNNAFHCGVQKTGSQWIASVLTDLRTYQYSGLSPNPFKDPRRGRLHLPLPPMDVPPRSITTPVFGSYQDYMSFNTSGPRRAFFVARDPRELVVSWYFSARWNHVVDNTTSSLLVEARAKLESMSQEEGFLYALDYLHGLGRFAALASWANAPKSPDIKIVRFEDLSAPGRSKETFKDIFEFLDIRMPDKVFSDLIDAYSFERLSGRKRTETNQRSHLRGGEHGEWRKFFTPALNARFEELTGDLVTRLEYSPV